MNKKRFLSAVGVAVLLTFGLFAPVGAQEGPAPRFKIEPPPHPPFQIDVRTDRSRYRIGDNAQVLLNLSQRSYVYVIHYDQDGRARLIFPNLYSRDNYIGPGRYRLPDGRYRYRVTGPPGTQYLQAIATDEQIDIYDFVKDRRDDFPVIPDPGRLTMEFEDGKFRVRFRLKISTEKGPQMGLEFARVKWDSAWTSFQVQKDVPDSILRARFDFSPRRPQPSQRVWFDASDSQAPDGRIVDYRWDFTGDGRTDKRGERVSYSFDSPGSYPVRLTVRDEWWRSDTVTETVEVQRVRPRLKLASAISFDSDGRRFPDKYRLERGNYARWRFDPISKPDEAHLNFRLRTTTSDEGSGYGARARIRILDRWGREIESGTLELRNPFRPQVERAGGEGQQAHGTYQIRNIARLNRQFAVKLELTQPDRVVFTEKSDLKLAYIT